jgi:hypothetical protein
MAIMRREADVAYRTAPLFFDFCRLDSSTA